MTETFSVKKNSFSDRKYFMHQKLISVKNLVFVILSVNSRENFQWEIGVSVILDDWDNDFVEPCTGESFKSEDFWQILFTV